MQYKTADFTDGVYGLATLFRPRPGVWNKASVEDLFSPVHQKILYYIADENLERRIPKLQEIYDKFRIPSYRKKLRLLEEFDTIIKFTIPELAIFLEKVLGLDVIHCGHYNLPEDLGWVKNYLMDCRNSTTWNAKSRNPTAQSLERHLIAKVLRNREACFKPLCLHYLRHPP